jgi:hypothetical protein
VRLRAKWPGMLVGLTGVTLLAAACSTGTGIRAGASTTTSVPATSTHPLSSHPKPGSTHKSTSTSTSTSTPTSTSTATAPTLPLRPGTCPQRWGYDTRLTSLNKNAPRPGLSESLVPDAPGPVYLTVCRYAGFNQKVSAGTLDRYLVVAGSDLATFVKYIDGPGFESVNPNTPYMCPMSTGQVDLLRFVYQSGSPVDVQVDVDGCPFVSNGHRTVWGGLIANRVTAWVGKDSFPT